MRWHCKHAVDLRAGCMRSRLADLNTMAGVLGSRLVSSSRTVSHQSSIPDWCAGCAATQPPGWTSSASAATPPPTCSTGASKVIQVSLLYEIACFSHPTEQRVGFKHHALVEGTQCLAALLGGAWGFRIFNREIPWASAANLICSTGALKVSALVSRDQAAPKAIKFWMGSTGIGCYQAPDLHSRGVRGEQCTP